MASTTGSQNPFHAFQSPVRHAHSHAVDMRATKKRRVDGLSMTGLCAGERPRNSHSSHYSDDEMPSVTDQEGHNVPQCSFMNTPDHSTLCTEPQPFPAHCGCYQYPALQDRVSAAVMQSCQGLSPPFVRQTHNQHKISPCNLHEPMYLPTKQTSTHIEAKTQSNAYETSSMSMPYQNFPNQQELPGLVEDIGGSSESSIFEPTPVTTPQDEQDDYSRATETEAGVFDHEMVDFAALQGTWDPTQGPKKYRTLAPKPPTPRPEQLPPNDEKERAIWTYVDPLENFLPAGRFATLPFRPLRSASQASTTVASNALGQNALHQNQIAGDIVGDFKPPQLFRSDAITGSSHLSPNPAAVQFLQQPDFTQHHGRASLLTSHCGQTQLPLPSGPASGVGSDFDALFDIDHSDPFPSNFAQTAYPDITFASLPTNETRPSDLHNLLQATMPSNLDPFLTGQVSSSLRNDDSLVEEEARLDHVNPGNVARISPMQPTASMTLPSQGIIETNPFSQPDLLVPTIPAPQSASFRHNTMQQGWNLDQDITTPTTPYRNSYDAAYPPLEDDDAPTTPFQDYSSDNFDFSSSPLYYTPNGSRNPSLPTTPHRTDERGARDTSMDDVLLAARSQGMTYKEIRDRYGFTEAESTLRGRYRTLTKPKDARVRKPTWNSKAITALLAAVHTYAESNHPSIPFVWLDDSRPFLQDPKDLSKIGWKKVAELIHNEGCYLYGNSTTKEKYRELRKAAFEFHGMEDGGEEE